MLKLCFYSKFILLLFALSAVKNTISQDHNIGSWTISNANIILNKKWNVFIDPHLYSDKLYNKFYYYEIKGTVGYKLSKHINIAAGTGKYLTYQREGNLQLPVKTNETRLFEQLFLTNYICQLRFDHRLQLEQRFFKSLFRNRLRYRANLTLPINKPASEKNSLFFAAYDELFLTDVSPRFLGNWLYAGLGYRVSKLLALQAGYARQYNYTGPPTAYKDFLVTSFLFSVDK